MTLMDMLESLAALYNKGAVDLIFMASTVHAKTIRQLLDWCRYFDIEIVDMQQSYNNIQALEREYCLSKEQRNKRCM